MNTHIVVDLETMGTSPESAIASIGAVAFDFSMTDAVTIKSRFYQVVDLQSCIDLGLKIDAATILWWLADPKVSQEARDALAAKDVERVSIETALRRFNEWYADQVGNLCQPFDIHIWSRGQDFDIGILRTAYVRLKIKHPWFYNMARDVRTFYDAANIRAEDVMPQNTGAHNALADAEWEATALIHIMKHHGRVLSDSVRKIGGIGEPYMPTADEAYRFMKSNPTISNIWLEEIKLNDEKRDLEIQAALIGAHGRPMPPVARYAHELDGEHLHPGFVAPEPLLTLADKYCTCGAEPNEEHRPGCGLIA